jgi:hypothetical protein
VSKVYPSAAVAAAAATPICPSARSVDFDEDGRSWSSLAATRYQWMNSGIASTDYKLFCYKLKFFKLLPINYQLAWFIQLIVLSKKSLNYN